MTSAEQDAKFQTAVELAEAYIRHCVPRLSLKDAILQLSGSVEACDKLIEQNGGSYDLALKQAALQKAKIELGMI